MGLLATVLACTQSRSASSEDSGAADSATALARQARAGTGVSAGAAPGVSAGSSSPRGGEAAAAADTLGTTARGVGASTSAPARTQSDSVRGTIAVTGALPLASVVLRPSDGGAQLTLVGASTDILRRLGGLEIAARGSRQGRARFVVQDFVVRSAAGRPVVEGRLAREGGRHALVLADGSRRSVADLPAALRDKVGARVYLVGRLDGDIEGFGVIDEPR